MMSIRFVRKAVVFSLAMMFVSAFVQAQPPGGGRGGPGGFGGGGFGGGRGGFNIDRSMLLRAEQVRKELKIEEAQAATIDAALEAFREERSAAPRPDRDAISKMSEEEQTALREKSQKERAELSKKTDEALGAMLEPEQAKRLDQIAMQMKLNMATVATLKSDDLKSKLSLTEEQVAKLDEAEKAAAADMTKMFEEMRAAGGGGQPGGNPGGGGGREAFAAMQEKMTAARAKSTEAALAVLTDEQKKMIDELKGAKFELDMRALMGGRGGPGGPGGPGGDGGGRPPRGEGGGRGTRPPAE